MRILPVLLLSLLGAVAHAQTDAGLVRDPDGNLYPWKRMPDNRLWLMRNLNFATEESWWYENDPAKGADYGRLYTFRVARNVCTQLGEGWRLPAREDWLGLAAAFGGVFHPQQGNGEAAFQALLKGGKSGFEAALGGGRRADGSFARGNAHGFYWMDTEGEPGMAWFLNFGAGSGRLFAQNDGEKEAAFAVRCVRDAP